MANSAPQAELALTAQKYQHALQLSFEMLETAKQGNWDNFIELNTNYIFALQNVLEERGSITHEDEEQFCSSLSHLLNNENEIRQLLKDRLDILSGKIDSIRQNQKCSNAYSSQLFSPYR
ncbi:flagellar protein FliT [Enterobacteriaceae bacterium YMB-R22]|jgi:flagellar protein FliT|uniref:flagellar protein FliT n=1 Tax=Tenebrionicola larvae TaxID=2815733 RepID=UPI0020122B44|nr:flagellar protein FliT [Tenebrionicola larvae]MBV4413973.1 flagellar protein FliT [Tenebrionicola larvae]